MFGLVLVPCLLLISTTAATQLPPDSFKLVLSKAGLEELEGQLRERVRGSEVNLTQLEVADVDKDQYKITNLRVTEVKLGSPSLSILPDEGVQIRQVVEKVVLEGDYKIKALFWWVDGKITLSAGLTVEVLSEITSGGGGVQIRDKECRVQVSQLDVDLHSKVLSTMVKLVSGLISDKIKQRVCEEVSKSSLTLLPTGEITSITATFTADRVEVSGRLAGDTNTDQVMDKHARNLGGRVICVVISKRAFKQEGDFKRTVVEFVPIMSARDLKYEILGQFVEVCGDLELKDIPLF